MKSWEGGRLRNWRCPSKIISLQRERMETVLRIDKGSPGGALH